MAEYLKTCLVLFSMKNIFFKIDERSSLARIILLFNQTIKLGELYQSTLAIFFKLHLSF